MCLSPIHALASKFHCDQTDYFKDLSHPPDKANLVGVLWCRVSKDLSLRVRNYKFDYCIYHHQSHQRMVLDVVSTFLPLSTLYGPFLIFLPCILC